jgi:hypothetical protein
MGHDTKANGGFLLRLPASIKQQASQLAHEDGTSLNHFISLAVAEKITRLEPEQVALHARQDAASRRSTSLAHDHADQRMRRFS